MRLRTHLISSLGLGLLLYPCRPGAVLRLTAAGSLIDLDHLLCYGLRSGDWSVVGALRYDRYRNQRRMEGDNRPRYGPLRSWLHLPWLVLPGLWAAALRWPALRPVAWGVSLHLALDNLAWLDGGTRQAVDQHEHGAATGLWYTKQGGQ